MATQPEPTISAPVTTTEAVNQMLAAMAALSGVLTDYNVGSQIRTLAESVGSVIEQQGTWTNAFVFQGMVYGAMALFGIFPGVAQSATVQLTFSTSPGGSPPPASQNVTIPTGTLVQSNGGIQFQTTSAVVLLSGNSSIVANAQAVLGGVAGNVPSGSLTQLVSNLGYPLFVTNASAATGGANAETLSETLSRLSAKIASIPGSSPVALANAAIGVQDPSTGETVMFSVLNEPFLAAGSGAGSGTAGWQLFIDNGFGTASSGLIAAVNSYLGVNVSGATLPVSGQVGFRDAGVPYGIYADSPIYANVYVSGTVANSAYATATANAIAAAVSGYFVLPFGAPAENSQIAAAVGNAGLGVLTSLTVVLTASGSPTAVSGVVPSLVQRVLLNSLSVSIVSGAA